MNTYSTHDFLGKLNDAENGNETWEIIRKQFCDNGFDVVNLGIMNAIDGTPRGFFTNMTDDWMNYYQDQAYNEVDPIVMQAVSSNDPFIFTQNVKDKMLGSENPLAQQMIAEVSEIGICSSIIVPFHNSHPGQIVGFNLGSRSESNVFLPFTNNNLEDILLWTALAQGFVPKLLTERENTPSWASFNQNIDKLTYRELETLNWLAAGFRVDRIAEKMNISNDTVNFHIKSIKSKLGAKTREHAVAIGFMEDLIR